MKKRLLPLLLVLLSVIGCETFDDTAIWQKLNSLEQRVNSIESTLSKLNTDLNTMSSMVNVLSNNLTITNVTTINDGIRISFSDGSSYTIKNGSKGSDGSTPMIGVKQFGNQYYWTQTIDGVTTWITDSYGNKIPASGTDGITPLLKISGDGYWMVSYDQGINYSYVTDSRGNLVPATGKGGDSFFQNVIFSDGVLTLVLLDGTTLGIDLNKQADPRMASILPKELQEELELYMPIYNGILPPDVRGTYYVSPFTAVYCEDYVDGSGRGYAPGTEVNPITIRFSNQDFKNNTLDYEEYEKDASSKGEGAFICGSYDCFSAYFSTEGTSRGIPYKTVLIISGIKSSDGIRNLYYAFGMVEKGADPDGVLMEEGVFRVFKDSDNLSANTTWNPQSESLSTAFEVARLAMDKTIQSKQK